MFILLVRIEIIIIIIQRSSTDRASAIRPAGPQLVHGRIRLKGELTQRSAGLLHTLYFLRTAPLADRGKCNIYNYILLNNIIIFNFLRSSDRTKAAVPQHREIKILIR